MSEMVEPDRNRLFALFCGLVEIDSESGREGKLCDYVKDYCRAMGLEAVEDGAGSLTGGDCGNLVVKVPPRTKGPPPVILNAHMDTVEPGTGVSPVDQGDRFSSSSDTVLGADDKAGVAAILETVRTLRDSGLEHRGLELVLTVQEETGLLGAKNLDTSLLDGKWGLVLDGSGRVGGIVVESPSRDDLVFRDRGRSAHAGVEPEKGINAIGCAARAIGGLRLGRLDEDTTANVGVITGGLASNIVPESVTVEAELRSMSDERLNREVNAMVDRFDEVCRAQGCSLEVERERSFDHFSIDTGSEPVSRVRSAMEDSGVPVEFLKSGGGSDANFLNKHGFQMVVLNIGQMNPHSKQEYILKEDLHKLTCLLVRLALESNLPLGETRA